MDVDSATTMEETVLVGDDLMLGPPSPIIPQEIASHVLEDVDLCDGILRNLFLCLQVNDIEPFCQDEIVLYRQCTEARDKKLRQRLQDSEYKLGLAMPIEDANKRSSQLQSEITTFERRLILASGIEGIEGFRQRWSLHGQLEDTKKRLDSLNEGISKGKKERKEDLVVEGSNKKKWFFW
ncbi:hypothetical protein ZOSMA_64G00700 [Zostera marina]|uniref:DUF7803 domain-containing protein n=1 Tax=Zostera marina TaxID=29655 RepID=A0A0K9NT92_ZOSMR|nr:hypothetical protein ZOSMA_64G00700 [Zostera marina]